MRFHHIGVACADIARELALLTPLGYAAEGNLFVDPGLGVRGQFATGSGPRLEFLEDLSPERAVIAPWRARGSVMYHQAYEVADLSSTISELREAGAKLTRGPTPAVAFGGREVAFLTLRNLMLVEFIATIPG
jgi:methylmalonyl-CoA/ethylmalonyl-CoA epimerase